MISRIAYDTIVSMTLVEGQQTSIIWISRPDAWMTYVIENLQYRLKVVDHVFREPQVFKTRYKGLFPVATANPQVEFLSSLRRYLRMDGYMLSKLSS